MTPYEEIVTQPTDDDITRAMVQYGGSFVSALGALWPLADDDNRARLRASFSEYWAQYRELVALKRKTLAKAETRTIGGTR